MDINTIIDESTIAGILSKNILSMEYEIQQYFEHEILVEMSASKSKQQKENLEELLKNARSYLSVDGCIVSLSLQFLSIPKGVEDYAEMIKSNSTAFIDVRFRNMISEIMSLDEAQEAIRNQVKEYAINYLQDAIGGM